MIRPNGIIPHIEKMNCPYVLSTIFVDYSETELNQSKGLRRVATKLFGINGSEFFKTIARWIKSGEPIMDYKYLLRGHKKSVEVVLSKAAMLLPNSENEFERIKSNYAFSTPYRVIPNAVSDELLKVKVNHKLKTNIVCIGRIEPLKNQLKLIEAVNQTDLKLKLIGKPAPNHIPYFEECKRIAASNVEFMGQLPKEKVIEELKSAKVHVLPSWFETTGLSSLEAAALECNLVITAKGDTKEYFEDFVTYCEPSNVKSIGLAVQLAFRKEYCSKLKDKIRENYLWSNTAITTLNAYQKVLDYH